MRYPPRLSHLATKPVVIAKLLPTYAAAHSLDDDEARDRLERALSPGLMQQLLESTWTALLAGTKRLDEAALLEKVAGSLADRPLRPGRVATTNPTWSAFLIVCDLEAGTASDNARKALETDQGRKMIAAGLAEAGKHLAAELTRK